MKNDSSRFVLSNARIYTMQHQTPVSSALVIENGKIVLVGDQGEISDIFQSTYRHYDMGGRTIIPGLVDAHIHLQHYALSLHRVDCDTKTREECLQNVAAKASAAGAGDWIQGHGWNQNDWREGFGDAQQLDRVAPRHPVYLTAKSLHAAWVNSIALQKAGVTKQTPDPPGGQIQRRPDGSPTGILFENAMTLVSDQIPKTSIRQVSQAIEAAQTKLWKMGITGAHDFDRRTCFAALQDLHQKGNLKLRVTKSIPIESLQEAIQLGLRSGFGDDFLRIGSVKAFADGALGPRTAAMLQPYESEPDNRGLLMYDTEELIEQGIRAVDNGLSLAIHAIGDSANHEVLHAYDQLRNREKGHDKGSTSPLRHRIEHVQIIHPDDLPRLAELGLIASMQPIHATSDSWTAAK